MSPVWVRPSLPVDLGQAEVGDPGRPSASSSRFDGLMSRWRTPWLVGVGQRLGDLDADAGHAAVVGPATGRTSPDRSGADTQAAEGRGRRPAAGRTTSRSGRRGPAPVVVSPATLRDAGVRRPGPPAASGRSSADQGDARRAERRRSARGRRGRVGGGAVASVAEPAQVASTTSRPGPWMNCIDVVVERPRAPTPKTGTMLVWCSRAAERASRRNRPSCAASSRPCQRQDLQRHVAAERLLLRLVDDPHPAAADLAEDAVLAQPLRRPPRAGRRRPSEPVGPPGPA